MYKKRINFWWFCQGNGCSIFSGFNSPVRNPQALPRLLFGCPLVPWVGHPCPDSNVCSGVDLGRERGIRTGVRSGGGAPSTKFFTKRGYCSSLPIQASTSWHTLVPYWRYNTIIPTDLRPKWTAETAKILLNFCYFSLLGIKNPRGNTFHFTA